MVVGKCEHAKKLPKWFHLHLCLRMLAWQSVTIEVLYGFLLWSH